MILFGVHPFGSTQKCFADVIKPSEGVVVLSIQSADARVWSPRTHVVKLTREG